VPIDPVELKVSAAGSYSSAELIVGMAGLEPPAISTSPVGKRMAECAVRAVAMDPVAAKVPVVGSYNSAEAITTPGADPPPAIRTLPLGNWLAVWLPRVVVIGPVGAKVPAAGSYSSAELSVAKLPLAPNWPPAIRTFPVGSSVVEKLLLRHTTMAPVVV